MPFYVKVVLPLAGLILGIFSLTAPRARDRNSQLTPSHRRRLPRKLL